MELVNKVDFRFHFRLTLTSGKIIIDVRCCNFV